MGDAARRRDEIDEVFDTMEESSSAVRGGETTECRSDR
jgi:hypothetical protein